MLSPQNESGGSLTHGDKAQGCLQPVTVADFEEVVVAVTLGCSAVWFFKFPSRRRKEIGL